MPQRRFQRNYATLSARVAHAYFKYGCFCSSHPIVTILFSIATLLLLSYPLTRLRLASSAPFQIITADNISEDALRGAITEEDPKSSSWLFDSGKRRAPMAYIQQLVVRARVHPWNSSELTPADAVKGPLELAFDLTEKLNSFRYESPTGNSQGLDDYCFRVQYPDLSSVKLHTTRFPSHKCLLLSPALLWGNDRQKFYEDNNVLDTIHEPHCTSSMCIRHLLFGMEGRHAGIKRQYRTNRQRDILFAITVILHKYDEHFLNTLRKDLESDPTYYVEETKSSWRSAMDAQRGDKFILIYYLRHKDLIQHVPLALSYFLLFVYLYYSVRKIEMVKSKWGLAFSAVFTIGASLVMATGICVNFDLTPRLWRGDLFPYLAMILGIENVIALTRSVVQTPVTLPVELRIAHGLSREGWLITKNFLIELAVVLVGVLTRVPEIQEFCTLGTIGLVVDFYMQLFFYAPCLTFDMRRFDEVEIQRQSVMQLTRDPVELVSYPPVRCPAMQFLSKFFPSLASYSSLFDLPEGDSVRRSRSLSNVYQGDSLLTDHGHDNPSTSTGGRHMGHRRTASNTSDISLNMEQQPGATNITALMRQLPRSRRLRLLLVWSRYRYCQKIFTVVVIVWISWLGLIVHQWHLIGKINYSLGYGQLENQTTTPGSASASPNDPDQSTATVESSWVHWALGQRTTFRWWPILFNIYNISLTGEYLVILPRIILDAKVSPERAKYLRSGVEPTKSDPSSIVGGGLSDLGVRISWLEFQMLAVLIMSAGIFLTVGGFILYVCFVGGDSATDSIYETDATPWVNQSGPTGKISPKKTHRRVGSKAIVEAVPLLFSKHEYEVEFVHHSNDILVSACLGGKILTWDAKTADLLNRVRPFEPRPTASGPADSDLRRRRAATQESRPTADSSMEDSLIFPQFDDDRNAPASVWCLDVQSQLIAAGYSNGDLELFDLRTGLLRGKSTNPNGVGATQIALKGSHVVVARLSGQLDFMELRLVQHGSPQRQQYLQCYLLKSITAHQHQINRLATTTMGVVTASDDHTLKLFDLHKYSCTCTFYGHNAPVINVTIDQDMQLMYSSCTDGLVCIWDLVDRCLIRTLPELSYTASPVALAFTNTLLVGHAQDGGVWLWKKSSGELVTRLKAETRKSPSGDGKELEYNNNLCDTPSLVVLNGNLAVTASRDHLRFWDLEYKAMLREVKLDDSGKIFGSAVKNLIAIDGFAVVCSKGSVLYRVDFPVIRAN